MCYEDFKKKYIRHAENSFEGEGLCTVLKELEEDCNGFKLILVCKKCKSAKVQVIGADGIDYGGMTGYSDGSNVFKCVNCGNAITIWK